MDRINLAASVDTTRGGSASASAWSQYYGFVTQAALDPSVTAGYAQNSRRSEADPYTVLEGWDIRGDWDLGWSKVLIGRLDGKLAAVNSGGYDGHIEVEVFSPEGMASAQTALKELMDKCPQTPTAPEERVEVSFWTNTAMGPRSYLRLLEAPRWKEIGTNYSQDVRSEVETLSSWEMPPAGGRLVIAHGPAGTGKTTAIRTLAHAWKSWCDIHYIVDPEEFFGEASYMISVLLGGESYTPPDATPMWRMIVVEDCDELLTSDAKNRSGQRVARLLNVCDGMVGQGLRILLFLTTNEKVENFHEAITRPGRCLKNIYFGPLDEKEADAWRTANRLPRTGEEATLAQLYAECRESVEINTKSRLRSA